VSDQDPRIQAFQVVVIEADPCTHDAWYDDEPLSDLRSEWATLPEPFLSALVAVTEAAVSTATCWQCTASVGYHEVSWEDTYGGEHSGIEWYWVGLMRELGNETTPVNALCEECTPCVWHAPVPKPER
jgi:hypothetical protein